MTSDMRLLFIAMIFRKPKLPIEMEYQGRDNDDSTSEGDEPLAGTQRAC